jgi:uncharacterized protein with HEPN domain
VRDDRERLRDVRDAIERIDRYVVGGREEFERNELVQVWVIHHLQIIGEAVRSLSAAFREQHADVPWRQIVGMRHILVHRYFGVDTDAVWSVVERDLPELKRQVESMLRHADAGSDPE